MMYSGFSIIEQCEKEHNRKKYSPKQSAFGDGKKDNRYVGLHLTGGPVYPKFPIMLWKVLNASFMPFNFKYSH